MEGYRIGDIGHAVQQYAESFGMGVIRDYTGHGTGTRLHEDPYIPNYGKPGKGARIERNMTLAIEPMIALGSYEVRVLGNDWTVVTIDGKKTAHVMIISGCDDGTMGMPNYMQNFRFACRLQQQMEGDYPGLTRPILFDYRKYNQDLTTGSLLIEVGTHGNTLEQVVNAGDLIGSSLARTLIDLEE
jgi:stage II sporulation protein P